MSNYRKGFTLIELLVVIFIIGLLASIVVVSVNTARMKARDARRMQDLDSIRSAIELYIDNNGAPPDPSGLSTYYNSNVAAQWSALQTSLSQFIPVLPKDPVEGRQIHYISTGCTPVSGTSSARYLYKEDGIDYKLGCLLEKSCAGLNTSDGGVSDAWYEIGSKPSMPW